MQPTTTTTTTTDNNNNTDIASTITVKVFVVYNNKNQPIC